MLSHLIVRAHKVLLFPTLVEDLLADKLDWELESFRQVHQKSSRLEVKTHWKLKIKLKLMVLERNVVEIKKTLGFTNLNFRNMSAYFQYNTLGFDGSHIFLDAALSATESGTLK